MANSPQTSGSTASSPAIDVWTFALDLSEAQADPLAALLSADERRRADRLVHPEDRARFQAAHGRLREIIGNHLSVAPREIVFGVEPNGKPYVANPETQLRFNLTHSDALAGVAISHGLAVGIDIERIKPLDGTGLEEALSRREQDALAALGGEERRDAFYRCWTRKEALLKAHGRGLGVPLDSFDVPVDKTPDAIVRFGVTLAEARDWRIVSFVPAPGYAGAVAFAAETMGASARLAWATWPRRG